MGLGRSSALALPRHGLVWGMLLGGPQVKTRKLDLSDSAGPGLDVRVLPTDIL